MDFQHFCYCFRYSNCLKSSKCFNPQFWLDIRGNHDEWDESGGYSQYYKQHSVYGSFHQSSVYFVMNMDDHIVMNITYLIRTRSYA